MHTAFSAVQHYWARPKRAVGDGRERCDCEGRETSPGRRFTLTVCTTKRHSDRFLKSCTFISTSLHRTNADSCEQKLATKIHILDVTYFCFLPKKANSTLYSNYYYSFKLADVENILLTSFNCIFIMQYKLFKVELINQFCIKDRKEIQKLFLAKCVFLLSFNLHFHKNIYNKNDLSAKLGHDD